MRNMIAQVVIGLPVEGPFDYLIPESFQAQLKPGSRVLVPFGPRRLVGYVVKLLARSRFKKLKAVLKVLDPHPSLDPSTLNLTKDFAAMYGCSWGEAIETALPVSLRRKKSFDTPPPETRNIDKKKKPEIIYYQDPARLDRWSFLIKQIREVLSRGQGVLVLVPDKVACAQLEKRLKDELDEPLAHLDKQLTAKKEMEHWLAVKSGKCQIVLGTRSAVFAPLLRPGLIVMFDEDHSAYKQDQTPLYHARDVVLLRSRLEKVPVLFINTAPSVELWHLANKEGVRKITASLQGLAPMRMIDLSNYKMRKRGSISFVLQNHIQDVLARNGRVVLLLNRRGFSTMIRCTQCNATVQCPRCEVNLTYIYDKNKLLCPLCHTYSQLEDKCPNCQAPSLRYTGAGIEKIESEAARLFPQAQVGRYDRDSRDFPKDAHIVIATQAVLRLADTLKADMIGVLDIDAELSRMDFRSSQRVFSLLMHLRAMAREQVVVQTFWNDHACFRAVSACEYKQFYTSESKMRRDCHLPPFVQLVSFCLRGKEKQKVFDRVRAVYDKLNAAKIKGLEVLEPQPDITPKLRDQYRFTIMLKGKSLKTIITAVKAASKTGRSRSGIIETINVNP